MNVATSIYIFSPCISQSDSQTFKHTVTFEFIWLKRPNSFASPSNIAYFTFKMALKIAISIKND